MITTGTFPARAADPIAGTDFDYFSEVIQPGGDFAFTADGTVSFTGTVIITADTTIDATGRSVILSGDGAVRLFQVQSNVSLKLINLTVADGSVVGSDGSTGNNGSNGGNAGGNGGNGGNATNVFGGAILNLGNLTLINCTLSGNSVFGGNGGNGGAGGNGNFNGGSGGSGGSGGMAQGGAIHNRGLLVLTNCTVAGNQCLGGNAGLRGEGGSGAAPGLPGSGASGANASGGGIWNGGVMRAFNSSFLENTVAGGISSKAGAININAGANGNTGGSGLGGGIYSTGIVLFVNCTFTSNSVAGGKGGDGGDGRFNGGNGGNGGVGSGGGIYNLAGNSSSTNCTFSTNKVRGGTNGAAGSGASSGSSGSQGAAQGGNVASGSGTFVLANTILAYPNGGGNSSGTFTDAGYNISSDGNPANLTATGSLKNTNPLLGKLGLYDGVTLVFPLLTGSPALNHSSTNLTLTVDQRGVARPAGTTNCDTGAFERQPLLIVTGPQSQTVTNGSDVTFTAAATGDSPISYKWYFKVAPQFGMTNTTFSLTNVQVANSGPYSVVVTNYTGAVTSAPAQLNVLTNILVAFQVPDPNGPELTNFVFTFNTQTGVVYMIEYKNMLTDPAWTRLVTNAGTGSLLTNQNSFGTNITRFFRILAQ